MPGCCLAAVPATAPVEVRQHQVRLSLKLSQGNSCPHRASRMRATPLRPGCRSWRGLTCAAALRRSRAIREALVYSTGSLHCLSRSTTPLSGLLRGEAAVSHQDGRPGRHRVCNGARLRQGSTQVLTEQYSTELQQCADVLHLPHLNPVSHVRVRVVSVMAAHRRTVPRPTSPQASDSVCSLDGISITPPRSRGSHLSSHAGHSSAKEALILPAKTRVNRRTNRQRPETKQSTSGRHRAIRSASRCYAGWGLQPAHVGIS